jgi:hypothetical protein
MSRQPPLPIDAELEILTVLWSVRRSAGRFGTQEEAVPLSRLWLMAARRMRLIGTSKTLAPTFKRNS